MKKTTIILGLAVLTLIGLGPGLNAQNNAYQVASVRGYTNDVQDLSQLPKMEKDIVILQNVLGELFSSKESSFYSNQNAKGMHIPGNGVIFNMGNSMYGSTFFEVLSVRETRIDGSSEKEEEELNPDELNKKNKENLRAKSKEFLANYGSLLSELKSGEKVMLNLDFSVISDRSKESTSDSRVAFMGPRANKKRMQSSISYKTISDFTSGKISLDQAMNAVEIKIVEDVDKDMTDAKILAGILDDLLQSSIDGKFKRRSPTAWTYFDGFGIMFNIQMATKASSSIVLRGWTGDLANSAVTVKRDDEKAKQDEELLKGMEEAYPEFENMLKENIVQYGRTLRSLKDGESIIINVDFGGVYTESKIPRSIRMVVPKSTIDAYAKGQKSLEQVKKEIDITKLQSAISNDVMFYTPSGISDQFFPAVINETATVPITIKKATGAVKSKK